MRKKNDLQKHTLFLKAGDYARMQAAYPEVGAAAVIRKLINVHLSKIDPPIDTTKIKAGEIP